MWRSALPCSRYSAGERSQEEERKETRRRGSRSGKREAGSRSTDAWTPVSCLLPPVSYISAPAPAGRRLTGCFFSGGWKKSASTMAAPTAAANGTRNRLLKSTTPPLLKLRHQLRPDEVGHQRAEAENHQVEQPLRAGARVLREELVHEDVDRREEERVADAVEHVDQDDELLVLRQEGEHREPRRMAEDADDHRRAPAELLQRHAEDRASSGFPRSGRCSSPA